MSIINFLIPQEKYLSATLIVILLAFQILLYSRYSSNSRTLLEFIFLAGLWWQIHQKQFQLPISKYISTSLLGMVLILLSLLRAKYIFLVEASAFWYLFVWSTTLSYLLFVAGFKGFRYFRHEILLCFIITLIPQISQFISVQLETASRESTFSITVLSAKLTSFLLWYIGFDSVTEGQIVYVNGGAIDIYYGCTGIPLFIQLFTLALLVVLIFPTFCRYLWLPFLLTPVLSLLLSIVRLAIMVLVVQDPESFNFWHGVEGGDLFMTLAMTLLFAIIVLTAPPQDPLPSPSRPQFPDRLPFWLVLSSSTTLLIILLNFVTDRTTIAGANQIADYKLPAALPLNTWVFQGSTPHALQWADQDQNDPDDNTDPNNQQQIFNFPIDQRSYYYRRGPEQITLELRYIVQTFGDVKSYYQKIYQAMPSLENPTERHDNNNYFLEFTSQGQQYTAACLNVQGKTTVTQAQFVSYFRKGYRQPTQVWQWLLGQRLLQDRRCLWIELSAPQGSTLTRPELRGVWQSVVDYWRDRFPPYYTRDDFSP